MDSRRIYISHDLLGMVVALAVATKDMPLVFVEGGGPVASEQFQLPNDVPVHPEQFLRVRESHRQGKGEKRRNKKDRWR